MKGGKSVMNLTAYDTLRLSLEAMDKTDHDRKQKSTRCEFVGGSLHDLTCSEYHVEHHLCNGQHIPDDSSVREQGGCTHYAVLDNVPEVDGYTPMWDGYGIRYESWDVYNSMFN